VVTYFLVLRLCVIQNDIDTKVLTYVTHNALANNEEGFYPGDKVVDEICLVLFQETSVLKAKTTHSTYSSVYKSVCKHSTTCSNILCSVGCL